MSRPATSRLKVNPPLGRPPVLEWIAPGELQVDESYQRSLEAGTSQTLIRRIASFWDWSLCQPINVARRGDGSLWIVDGQHRHAAAVMRGDVAHLPCVIQNYATRGDEAAAFVDLNKQRRPLGPVDVFKAALAAGDEEATDVMRLMRAAGIDLAPHQNYVSWKPGMLFCVPTIQRGYRVSGKAVTGKALRVLAAAYSGQVLQFAGWILEGLIPFIASEQAAGASDGELIAMLQRRSQSEWTRRAKLAMANGDRRREAMRAVLAGAWGVRTIGGQAPAQRPRPLPEITTKRPPVVAPIDPNEGKTFCAQCDHLVSPAQAAACASSFCSLRKVA